MPFLLFASIFLLPFLGSAVVAYLISPVVLTVYHKLKWLDDPKKQTHAKVVHTTAIPRGGGVVIFVTLLAGVAWFLGFDKHSLGIVAGGLLLAITGVLDDLYNLNPYVRLLVGIAAALLVVSAGIGIAFVTNPFSREVIRLDQPQITFSVAGQPHSVWVLADILAIFWIVWCMNMINWSKGLDGQLPGVVVIAAVVIALLSFRFTEDVTQWAVSILAGITAGAFLGFLPWNFYPQKMMPGYGAGSLAGYLLAVLSILSGAKLATLMLVLAIPMIDAVYVIGRRIISGKSPVWGDRGHFHHKLMDLGWGKRRIAVFYWLMTLLLGVAALQLNARQKAFTIALLAFGFGALLLWVNYFILSSKRRVHANG